MAETTKTPATNASATKAPARKAPAKKAATPSTKGAPTKSAPRPAARPKGPENAGAPGRSKGIQMALQGAQQLVELTGKEFEGIVGVSQDADGWAVQVEVLELRRIPNTTDVLGIYEVTVDGNGDLVGYRRADRYVRGTAREERS